MNEFYLAFLIGLLGSVHCLGMCGPLAFALPSAKHSWLGIFGDKLSYQLGRIISYALLGLLGGLLSARLWMNGMQQTISLICGILIILIAIYRLSNISLPIFRNNLLQPFNMLMEFAFKQQAGHLIIGMINGLLPCGMVYMALAGAVNTGSMENGMIYMICYGFGTLPLMLFAAMAAGKLNYNFRQQITRMVPYFLLILGIWFICRGLELQIPYLSPAPISVADC